MTQTTIYETDNAETSTLLANGVSHVDDEKSVHITTISPETTSNPMTVAASIPTENEFTNFEAMKELMTYSIPYVFSRTTLAIPWFTDGLILKQLGETASLSGPTLTSLKACIIGFCASFMNASGVVGGNYAAAGEKLEADGHIEEAKKKYEQMGRVNRQTFLTAIPLTLISGSILFYIAPIAKLFHSKLPDEILDVTQEYSRWFTLSVLPSLWMNGDKQFAMAINRPNIATINTLSHVILSTGAGYTLALFTDLRMNGMAIGLAASAWLNMAALKLYFLKPEFAKYKLNNFRDEAKFEGISEVLNHGAKIGFFSLTEWANIAAISFLATHANKDAIAATQVSFQFMVPYSFSILAFAQASGVLIARYRGKRDLEVSRGRELNQIICEKNIRKIGHANIILCTTVGLGASAIVSICRKPFTNLFIHSETAKEIAEQILLINCLGVVLDSIRASAAGDLRGFKDTLFPPLISLLFMSIMGLSCSAGFIFEEGENVDPHWLFTPRVIGLLLSAVAMTFRWDRLSRVSEIRHLINNSELGNPLLQPEQKAANDAVTLTPAPRSPRTLSIFAHASMPTGNGQQPVSVNADYGSCAQAARSRNS